MAKKIIRALREFYLSEGLAAEDLDTVVRMADIQYHVPSAGPGLRAEVFFQGCPHTCKDCINMHIRAFTGGRKFKVYEMLGMLDPTLDPGYYTGDQIRVTIGGGEPFSQLDGLLALVRCLSQVCRPTDRHILLYSGYTLDELVGGTVGDAIKVREIFKLANVLVDGKYFGELSCLKTNTSFIGSENQRYIILNHKGRPVKVIDALTANSIQGDIEKKHLTEGEKDVK
jgi:anaerobic ribonucleoside-triphosphate reductase activating protein